MTRKPQLGFIGLGLMGTAMSLRLLEKGWALNVWNLEPERITPVVDAGAIAKASPAAVTQASDIVLMCVLHTQAVEQCVFGKNGIAKAATANKILIDHSTIDPAKSREFAARLQVDDRHGLDRCAGVGRSECGASGHADRDGRRRGPRERCRVTAVMADLSANFTHAGSSGAGQMAKVINQAIVGTTYVLMAEALMLAEAAGIDAAKLPQCLAGGHADSNSAAATLSAHAGARIRAAARLCAPAPQGHEGGSIGNPRLRTRIAGDRAGGRATPGLCGSRQ